MITKSHIISAISKGAMIGTGIVFGINIVCLAIAYVLNKETPSSEEIGIITIILALVGIGDLIAGFILKIKMLSPLFAGDTEVNEGKLWQHTLRATVIVAAICGALPIYGMVAYLIEGNMNTMVAFAMCSLAGFMVLRLRPRDFAKLKLSEYRSDFE